SDFAKRISKCGDNASDVRLDKRLRARRRLALVAARLQGHIAGGAASLCAGLGESTNLRMRSAELLVPAFADDGAVAHKHSSDEWIGLDRPAAALGEFDGATHEVLRRHAGNVVARPRTRHTSRRRKSPRSRSAVFRLITKLQPKRQTLRPEGAF